jgi:hypothetical protein
MYLAYGNRSFPYVSLMGYVISYMYVAYGNHRFSARVHRESVFPYVFYIGNVLSFKHIAYGIRPFNVHIEFVNLYVRCVRESLITHVCSYILSLYIIPYVRCVR